MALLHESGHIISHDKERTSPPYGALDYFQIHFIVMGKVNNTPDLIAKCNATTAGYFSKKRVEKIHWVGGKIADVLSQDQELNGLLRKVLLREAEIYIDPLDDHVRIYGKWKHQQDLGIYEELVQAMDRISYHIKAVMS